MYKRQAFTNYDKQHMPPGTLFTWIGFDNFGSLFNLVEGAKTVSYTHLDVYKRQGQLEMHKDAVKEGMRIAIFDDLLATGGTAKAACELVELAGAEVVSLNFVIELTDLGGRDALGGYDVFSLVQY